MDVNFNRGVNKTMNTSIELDKLKIIDSKKEWEKSWVSGQLRSTLFIRMLETCGFKFSDFLIINLYSLILFNNIGKENTKNVIEDLRCLITITKKEEEDLIRNGFRRNKHEKKIYKRLIKSYFVKINEKRGLVVRGLKQSEITGKDCLIMLLDTILNANITEEKVVDELGKASESNSSYFFVYYYLVSLYMGYEGALNVIEVYGEILSGEFKHSVQESLVQQLAKFVRSMTNKNLGLDDIGLDLAVDLVESENIQLQNDKSFYSKRYLEAIEKIYNLEETIKELQEELEFFKNIYKNKLKNKKILLIGDKKKELEYKDIITSFGGEMAMYDSFDDFSKITNATLDGFDYIIHFTYYTSHSVSNKLDKYSKSVFFVNSSSRIELEKVLISI